MERQDGRFQYRNDPTNSNLEAVYGSAGSYCGLSPRASNLSGPLGGSIAEPLDTNATWQPAFDCSFDESGREEGQRDHHIDLTNAALFAGGNFFDRLDLTRHNFV